MDYTKLERHLRSMRPRQKLYELVKAEMLRRGRWKTKPRGTGFKLGYDPRRQR